MKIIASKQCALEESPLIQLLNLQSKETSLATGVQDPFSVKGRSWNPHPTSDFCFGVR